LAESGTKKQSISGLRRLIEYTAAGASSETAISNALTGLSELMAADYNTPCWYDQPSASFDREQTVA